MTRVGVCLSGCGMHDGSEVHEATLTLLFLDKAGAEIVCLAPDIDQCDVINHITGRPENGKRRVIAEAARIARGNIRDIKQVTAGDLDALIFPGGVGAAKNLTDYYSKGADLTVEPEVARLVTEMHAAGKPLGFICISPVIGAKVLGAAVTFGSDRDTAAAIVKMGGTHAERPVGEIMFDEKNRVVSTPAYMMTSRIAEIAVGIEKLVNKVLALA